ncbi:MAG: hypothetical protein K6C36_03575 [Clostridia bacterium]|nr:hypothetical protein [Clostridia bacterium]
MKKSKTGLLRAAALVLAAMFVVLSVSACGNTRQKNTLPGTWKPESVVFNGSVFSPEEIKQADVLWDEDSLSDMYIVLKDGGAAYAFYDGDGELISWEESEDSVKIGELLFEWKDGKLTLNDEGNDFAYEDGLSIIFTKVSDSQDINYTETTEPKAETTTIPTTSNEITTITPETTAETTTEVHYYDATTETTTQAPTEAEEEIDASGVRPEIKEIIDGYETFIDQYIAFMTAFYSGSIHDYFARSDMQRSYSDWGIKFRNIEDDYDLTAKEEQYYIMVSNRCMKKISEYSAKIAEMS